MIRMLGRMHPVQRVEQGDASVPFLTLAPVCANLGAPWHHPQRSFPISAT